MLEIMCHSGINFTFVNNIKYSLTTLLGFFSYYICHKLHLLTLQPFCFYLSTRTTTVIAFVYGLLVSFTLTIVEL